MDPSREQALHEHERAFRRAGLPTLIEDYSAAEDVFTRALPLFALVYILEILNALNADFSTAANAGAFLGGLALAIGAFGVFNLASGIALLVASALAGLLWDRLGGGSTFLAGAAISTVALVALAWKVPSRANGR